MNNDLEDRVKRALDGVLSSVSNAPVDRDRVEHRRQARNRGHIRFAMAVGSVLVVVGGLSALAIARSTDGVSTTGNPDTSSEAPQPSDSVIPPPTSVAPQTTSVATTGTAPSTSSPVEPPSVPDDYSVGLVVGVEAAGPEGTPFIRIWREYRAGVEFLMMDFTRANVPAGAAYWDVLIDGKLAFRSNATPTPGTRGHRLAIEQFDREIALTVQLKTSDLSVLSESNDTVKP